MSWQNFGWNVSLNNHRLYVSHRSWCKRVFAFHHLSAFDSLPLSKPVKKIKDMAHKHNLNTSSQTQTVPKQRQALYYKNMPHTVPTKIITINEQINKKKKFLSEKSLKMCLFIVIIFWEIRSTFWPSYVWVTKLISMK